MVRRNFKRLDKEDFLVIYKTALGILHTGLVTTSDQRHTVFRASPKISDKSCTGIKEIHLHRQTKENGTYHIAKKKSQRRHD